MADEQTGKAGIGTKALKIIGVITAIISLILGVRQIVNMIQENAVRKNKAFELKAEAQHLAASGLYSKAWDTMTQAVELNSAEHEARVGLAMEWLRNARISGTGSQPEKSFSDIVNKLSPVLHRAIDTTRSAYAATVRAHIGWAGYLLFKEGDRSVKVEEHFREALRLDSTNVYAHVMYGFWLLYPGHSGGTLDEANAHFAGAVNSGMQRHYVRHLMIAAYQNRQRPDCQAHIIKVANEMRRNGEVMERADRERILGDAYFLYRNEIFDEVGRILSPDEHLATFTYLTDGVDLDGKPYLKEALARFKNP
ncbi:MAG: hypothetical protein KF749_10215 [Bacteroidetes bacterium]|nr:hypothetical protein [Bacteroidota bacterium]MCW5896662.1 hypothetical protein [Bacteroidota bacterium]